MTKNILITPKAYNALITDLQFQPHQLLAKRAKSDIRIKSPKTKVFIHVGSRTYNELLKDYTEADLLKRRDGFIKVGERRPIKVFSKSFNKLLDEYELDELLSLPRIDKNNKKNNKNKKKLDDENAKALETLEERIRIILSRSNITTDTTKKQIDMTSLLTETDINSLIKSQPRVCVFITAIYHQEEDLEEDVDEDVEEDVEDVKKIEDENNIERRQYRCFYASSCTFDNGTLSSFNQIKEIRMEPPELLIIDSTKGYPNVNKCHRLSKALNGECDDCLHDMEYTDIDIASTYTLLKNNDYSVEDIKNYLTSSINTHYQTMKTDVLFDMTNAWLWFLTNARCLDLINTKVRKMTALPLDAEEGFEMSEKVIAYKMSLINEVNDLKVKLVEYVNTL